MNEQRNTENVLGCLGAYALIGFCILALAVLTAWGVSVLWNLLLVPEFGLPTISVPFAFCMGTIADLLSYKGIKFPNSVEIKKVNWETYIQLVVNYVVSPLITILIGLAVYMIFLA